MVKVHVKWGKELYKDVEADVSQSPLVFKSQLFTLSGVPPERQKVLIKGGQLKDDEWGKTLPKEGMTVMLMGSADEVKVEAPANLPKFVEDLPESEQHTLETRAYGSGLKNLGNTCYMNSTLQCLYSVEGLRSALAAYAPAAAAAEPNAKLAASAKELFATLQRGGEPVPPFSFLLALRQRFPQFAQQTNEGFYMQQDAEECWTQIMHTLKEQLKDGGQSVIERLFGIQLVAKLKAEETGEEFEERNTAFSLKCNISIETNYLAQGLALALVEDREKNSAAQGRLVQFRGSARIASLPPFLTVQMMRFFYKVDTQQKAKILRKVTFPLELDVFDLCTPELQAQLAGPREAHKAAVDAAAEARKRTPKQLKTEAGPKPGPGSEAPAPSSAAPADVEMADAGADAAAAAAAVGSSNGSGSPAASVPTGRFELSGVLTHKGRSADSGHYVAWVKQQDGSWVLFDDDELHIKTAEDVLALSGGGDWHMAYLLMYRAVTVPAEAAAAAAAGAGAGAQPPAEAAAAPAAEQAAK